VTLKNSYKLPKEIFITMIVPRFSLKRWK